MMPSCAVVEAATAAEAAQQGMADENAVAVFPLDSLALWIERDGHSAQDVLGDA